VIAADLAAPLIEAMQSLGSERFERMHGRGPPCRPRDRDETHNRNHNAREQQCQRIVRCHADQDVSDQLAKRHGDCQASEKRDKDSNLYAVAPGEAEGRRRTGHSCVRFRAHCGRCEHCGDQALGLTIPCIVNQLTKALNQPVLVVSLGYIPKP